MAFTIALTISFVPAFIYAAIVYWLDRFEKEPLRLLIGAFFWGAFVATMGAIIWTSVLQLGIELLVGPEFADVAGTTLLAPIVEEVLKGLAVTIIFLAFPDEFDSVLDGMVYGAITALGFAATENVLYLFFMGYGEGGYEGMFTLFVLRVILGGWGHAVYTAFFGAGLALGRLRPGKVGRVAFPLIGLLIAIFLHALHNTMAVFLGELFGLAGLAALLLVDWTGWAIALGVVFWALLRERNWMRLYLREEVAAGLMSEVQYREACSLRGRLLPRFYSHETRRFYTLCAELAQKKHQLATLGDERGNAARVKALRAQLQTLTSR
ncbi:MAG: PrsW family intramembrane metalloprotease [Oscillochloridaceae bacterium umkhey_bin13]